MSSLTRGRGGQSPRARRQSTGNRGGLAVPAGGRGRGNERRGDYGSVRSHLSPSGVLMVKTTDSKRKSGNARQAQISMDEEGFIASQTASVTDSRSRLEESAADTTTDPLEQSREEATRVTEVNDDVETAIVRRRSPLTVKNNRSAKEGGENGERSHRDTRASVSSVRSGGVPDSRKRTLSLIHIPKGNKKKKVLSNAATVDGRGETPSEDSNVDDGMAPDDSDNDAIQLSSRLTTSGGEEGGVMVRSFQQEAIATRTAIKNLVYVVSSNTQEIKERKKVMEEMNGMLTGIEKSSGDRSTVKVRTVVGVKKLYEEVMESRMAGLQ